MALFPDFRCPIRLAKAVSSTIAANNWQGHMATFLTKEEEGEWERGGNQ